MRTTRITAALVALVMMAALPYLATGSATATSAKAKPAHTITGASLKEVKRNTFIAKGTVSTFKNKKVTLQQKTCKKCSYHFYKKVKTSKIGYFRSGVAFSHRRGGTFCYKLKVPNTGSYRASSRFLGCINTY